MQRILVERELTSDGPAANRPRKGRRFVTVNIAEAPLAWLNARKMLTERQVLAGERLRADWETVRLSAVLTMRWDPVRVSSGNRDGLTPSERQIAARARFDGAVKQGGPDLADMLWRVVCAGESLPTAERALAWPVRSGKLVLRIALDRVAEYYRIGG